jgi:hypothetical protein
MAVARELAGPIRAGNARFEVDRSQIRHMRRNRNNPPAIFVWIPKAAGTSLAAALETQGGQTLVSVKRIKSFQNKGVVTFGHIYLPALVEAGLASAEFVSRAFKFAIVRNPYDRLISLFEYLKRTNYLPKTTTFSILCHYVEERAVEEVGLINHDGLSQLNPQVTWLVDRRWRTMVDKIYRYEELWSSWPDIWHDIGFGDEPPDLPKLNESEGRREPHDYFSESTISIAQKAFRNDFETLGYSMAPYWLASVGHELSPM